MFNSPNMTIARVPKDKNFTCLSTAVIFDINLSDTARLLLIQMLSVRAEKWNLNIDGLRTTLKRGEKAVKSALSELEQYGYLFKRQVKDEKTQQFGHNWYWFYESPSLNPHFGNNLSSPKKVTVSALNEPDFFAPAPSDRNPVDGQAEQSNINPSNIEKLNMDMGQSVAGAERKTDRHSTEKNFSHKNETELSKITDNLLKETKNSNSDFQQFITDTVRNLNSILNFGIASPDEVISKLKEIQSAEHSLIPFMTELQEYCEESLKNLRVPHARDHYLQKVISGFLMRYTPCSAEQTQKSKMITKADNLHEKPLPFGEMLLQMNHPDVTEDNYQNYPFDTQEHFVEYYGKDCHDWNKYQCQIPDSFRYSQPTMLNALRFLFGSCLAEKQDEEFRTFSEECISYLAEAICTGKRSYTGSANSWNLMTNINYLNTGIYGNEVNLFIFMKSFYFHFRKKLKEYSVKSNYKGYVTSMLVSYLGNEYLAQARVKSTEFDIFEDTD